MGTLLYPFILQCEWTPDYLAFSFDNEEIGRITFPEGGMWEHGGFAEEYPGMVDRIQRFAEDYPGMVVEFTVLPRTILV